MYQKKTKATPRFFSYLTFILITILSPLAFCSFELNPDKDYWKILESVKLITAVVEETEYLYLKPTFPRKIRRLEGQRIEIEGYLIDLGKEGYVLTKYLSSRGQCRSLGPGHKETIALDLPKGMVYKSNAYVTIVGELQLNYMDPTKLIYTLKHAKCLDCRMVYLKKT